MDREWTVEVGFTSTRPVRPDEHWTRVRVVAADAVDAQLVAAQMVAAIGHAHPWAPHAEMVTSTLIVDWQE
jgi:hypothetical protein